MILSRVMSGTDKKHSVFLFSHQLTAWKLRSAPFNENFLNFFRWSPKMVVWFCEKMPRAWTTYMSATVSNLRRLLSQIGDILTFRSIRFSTLQTMSTKLHCKQNKIRPSYLKRLSVPLQKTLSVQENKPQQTLVRCLAKARLAWHGLIKRETSRPGRLHMPCLSPHPLSHPKNQ